MDLGGTLLLGVGRDLVRAYINLILINLQHQIPPVGVLKANGHAPAARNFQTIPTSMVTPTFPSRMPHPTLNIYAKGSMANGTIRIILYCQVTGQ